MPMFEKTYTDEQCDWLRENYGTVTSSELAKRFNEKFGTSTTAHRLTGKAYDLELTHKFYTPEQCDWLIHKSLLYSDKELSDAYFKEFGIRTSSRKLREKARKLDTRFFEINRYSPEEIEFLKENAMKYSYPRLSKMLKEKFGTDRSDKGLRSFCGGTLGIKKGAGYYNETYGNFRPEHTKNVGDRMIMNGHPFIKVSENRSVASIENWKAESVVVWEAAGNELPDGYVVIHLDGDVMNNSLDNLRAISKATLGQLNLNGFAKKGELTDVAIKWHELTTAVKNKKIELEEN